MSEANAPQQRADQAAGTIEALTKQIQQLKAQRDAVIRRTTTCHPRCRT